MHILKNTFSFLLFFLSIGCSSQKQFINSTDYENFRIKSLSVWQIKKELLAGDYTIYNINRSWIKDNESSISINSVSATKGRRSYSLAFDMKNNNLRANTKISNQITYFDFSVFSPHITLPISGNETINGVIDLGNENIAQFLLINQYKGIKSQSEGSLKYNNISYKIDILYSLNNGVQYTIMNKANIVGKANTIGYVALNKNLNENDKIVFNSLLTALIFDNLNNQ